MALLDAYDERKREEAAQRRKEEPGEEEKQPLTSGNSTSNSASLDSPLSTICASPLQPVESTAVMERVTEGGPLTSLLSTPASTSSSPPSFPSFAVSDLIALLPSHLLFPFTSYESQHAVECLWYLLHHHPTELLPLLLTPSALQRLTHWTASALRSCQGSVEKQRRNNLIALLTNIAHFDEAKPLFVHRGLIPLALTHATHTEQRMEGILSEAIDGDHVEAAFEEKEEASVRGMAASMGGAEEVRWTQSMDAADVELRQLLWTLLASLSSHWLCHGVIHQGRLLSALLHYVDASARPHWLHTRVSPSQLLELQRSALVSMRVLAPSTTEQFEGLRGVERLIGFVQAMTRGLSSNPSTAIQCEALRSLAVSTIEAVVTSSHSTLPHPELDALLRPQSTPSHSTSSTSTPSASPPPSRPSTSLPSSAASSQLPTPARLSLQATLRTLLSLVSDSTVAVDCRCSAMSAVTALCAEVPEHRRVMRRERGVELLSALLSDSSLVSTLVAQSPAFLAHMVHRTHTSTHRMLACQSLHLSKAAVSLRVTVVDCVASSACVRCPVYGAVWWVMIRVWSCSWSAAEWSPCWICSLERAAWLSCSSSHWDASQTSSTPQPKSVLLSLLSRHVT